MLYLLAVLINHSVASELETDWAEGQIQTEIKVIDEVPSLIDDSVQLTPKEEINPYLSDLASLADFSSAEPTKVSDEFLEQPHPLVEESV